MRAQRRDGLGEDAVVVEVAVELGEEGPVLVGRGGRRDELAQEQHGHGGDVLAQVRAGRLAGLGAVGHDVEDVVGELEGDSRLLPEPGHGVDDGGRGAPEQRPEAGRRREEGRGLVGQHPEVVVDGLVAAARADGLVELPEAQALERPGLEEHGLGPELRHEPGRAGEQQVPGEDRDRVPPDLVGGRGAAPHGRRVHDVVVVQGREVRELHDGRRGEHLVARTVAELRGEQREVRTQALAAGGEQVARGLVDQGVLVGDGRLESFLDELHAGGQPGAERVVDDGEDGGHGTGGSGCHGHDDSGPPGTAAPRRTRGGPRHALGTSRAAAATARSTQSPPCGS